MALTKWIPESDPMVLRRVGKTGEECAELAKVCSRVTIQGLDGVDPATGESNRRALAKEIADVMTQCEVTIEALSLPRQFIEERTDIKRQQMAEWEAMFSDPAAEPERQAEPVVYLARSRYGSSCSFGMKAAATAWAGEGGEVYEIPLRHLGLVAPAPVPAST